MTNIKYLLELDYEEEVEEVKAIIEETLIENGYESVMRSIVSGTALGRKTVEFTFDVEEEEDDITFTVETIPTFVDDEDYPYFEINFFVSGDWFDAYFDDFQERDFTLPYVIACNIYSLVSFHSNSGMGDMEEFIEERKDIIKRVGEKIMEELYNEIGFLDELFRTYSTGTEPN